MDEGKERLNDEYRLDVIDEKWEIDRRAINVTGTLGEGAFGKVVLAEVNVDGKCRKVAVKTLKEGRKMGHASIVSTVT